MDRKPGDCVPAGRPVLDNVAARLLSIACSVECDDVLGVSMLGRMRDGSVLVYDCETLPYVLDAFSTHEWSGDAA